MFRSSIPLDWVPMGINHTPNIWLTVQLWLIDQENKRSKDSMHFLRLGIQKFICITTDEHWPKKLKPQYMNLQHDSHRSFQLAMRKTRSQHSINKYIHTYTCMYPFYCGILPSHWNLFCNAGQWQIVSHYICHPAVNLLQACSVAPPKSSKDLMNILRIWSIVTLKVIRVGFFNYNVQKLKSSTQT